jgi:(p)ppGpp synthase/HD superfamily hydrolase
MEAVGYRETEHYKITKQFVEQAEVYMTNIELALEIATRAHKNQVDKAGAAYILHPMAVAEKVSGEDEKVVALLHDVIEDTDINEASLRILFGDKIADAVLALTRKSGETYMDFIARAKANPLARKVKIADIEHNSDLSRLQNIRQEDLERVEKYKRAKVLLEE